MPDQKLHTRPAFHPELLEWLAAELREVQSGLPWTESLPDLLDRIAHKYRLKAEGKGI